MPNLSQLLELQSLQIPSLNNNLRAIVPSTVSFAL
uniref:Uncharacterized protein n=1 Tax=Rhizophora mucronata TaxID=61149 RepID=A0A2P2IZC0_RHIMU